MRQIVISIPEDEYQRTMQHYKKFPRDLSRYERRIVDGIPLPKGHGKIVDMNNVHLELDEFMYNIDGVHEFLDDEVTAIIEADKEG